MTISMPGLEPLRDAPSAPRSGAEDSGTNDAFVAALLALLLPPVAQPADAPASGTGGPATPIGPVPATAAAAAAPPLLAGGLGELPDAALPVMPTAPDLRSAGAVPGGPVATSDAAPVARAVGLLVPSLGSARPAQLDAGSWSDAGGMQPATATGPTLAPQLAVLPAVTGLPGVPVVAHTAVGPSTAVEPSWVPVAAPTAQLPDTVTAGTGADAPRTPTAPGVGADAAAVPMSHVPPPPPAATSPVVAAQSPAPAPPAAHVQVVHALAPLRHAPDGSYSLEVQLHPRDLGLVQVTVELRHGQLSIHLHAADAGAGDLLRDNLPDLREQLEAQGLQTADLDVGSGGPRGRPTPDPRHLTPAPAQPARPDDLAGAPAPAPTAAAPSNGLDIRL